MDKFALTELVSIPSVVFVLEYLLTTSRNIGKPLEFSLFMALVAFVILLRRNVKNGSIKWTDAR